MSGPDARIHYKYFGYLLIEMLFLVFFLMFFSNFGALSGLDAGSAIRKKLLFLPFYNEAADTNFIWLEATFGNSIDDIAQRKFAYLKISDADFERYFRLRGLETKDLFDLKKVRKIGSDLGADGIIFGTFKPDAEGKAVIVTGKILSVIDNEVIAEKTVVMPISSDMFASVEEVSTPLGANIQNLFYPSNTGAMSRAAMLPGWGHRYKQRADWGYVWGSAFWSALAFTAISTFQFVRYSVLYNSYSPDHNTASNGGTGFRDPSSAAAQFATYGAGVDLWGTLTLISLIGTAVIYAGNILHAYYLPPNVASGATTDEKGNLRGLKLDYQTAPNGNSLRLSFSMNF